MNTRGWIAFARLAGVSLALGMGGSLCAEEYALPEKGKTVSVTCLEFPSFSYDVFVPEAYDPAKPCAIIYTFNPGGGGMIEQHQSANEVTPTIVVGIKSSKNDVPEQDYFGEIYAALLDTHERFNLDPGAQYCGGLSGGAVSSFSVARQSRYVCGVISSGGWLARRYDPWYIYPRGLWVARITGVDDVNALSWAKRDADHLSKSGCTVKDWSQPGGHLMGTPENVKLAMRWLVANKAPDKNAAQAGEREKKWAAAPYAPAALKEMLDAVRSEPHSRLGNLAMRQFMRIMKDDAQFCRSALQTAPDDDFNTFFGYLAHGAALAKDTPRLKSAAYALDKVCPNKKSPWHARVATLLLFSGARDAGTEAAVPKYIGSPTMTPGLSAFHRAVYAAALLKSGKRFEAAPLISKLPSNPENKKLAAAIADLKKNAGQKAVEFDDKLWMALLDEDDQSKDEH